MALNKKHILIVSQYFYPEQFRINDISVEWIKRGYKVTVISGIPNYPQGEFYKGYGIFRRRKDDYFGVNIRRIPIMPRGHNSVSLTLNYISFVMSGLFWSLITNINADYVFIFGLSPAIQALPGVWFSSKKRIPCYLYVQDLWPESVIAVGRIKNKLVIKILENIMIYIYKKCTKIFTTSKSFMEVIREQGIPESKLRYWPQYAEDFYKPLKTKNVKDISSGMFNVIFTGNIGKAQGLDILLKAALVIKKSIVSKEIRFNIIGEGSYKKEMIELINKFTLSDMFNFIPKQPPDKIPEYLAASDVAFLSLADEHLFSMTIPAKLQTYLACGIPIIASASGETDRIIRESHSGICCEPGNVEQLAKAIISMAEKSREKLDEMGKKAKEYYDSNFDKQRLLCAMDEYLN